MPLPARQGLYDPDFEHDACGLGFVASLRRAASHEVVAQGLEILSNLTHRGAAGCDPCTGDGAGILLQIPHQLYAETPPVQVQGGTLPQPGDYAVAMCFFPTDPARRRRHEAILEATVVHHGQRVLGWRDVPIASQALGVIARDTCPHIRQLFIGRTCAPELFERTLYLIRKRAGKIAWADDFYIVSCSSRTVVYKGLMLPEQIADFYLDLSDPRTVSRLALVHSRFSTNTFPTWDRAHPFRLLAHNGEINTLRGNRTWMSAREWLLRSQYWRDHLDDFRPIVRSGGSDSAALDNVADFLVASGRSLPHVMMMLIPEAWVDDPAMSDLKKAFYEYHGALVEPWDGPAAIGFTDGRLIGATLDRNGLRPAKYVVTDDMVVLASELGVLDIDPTRVKEKGRIKPGKMFLVDVEEGRIVSDEEIKNSVAAQRPYRRWLEANKIDLDQLPPADEPPVLSAADAERLRLAFGYTQEDVRSMLTPMAATGEEPIGSMGIDIPLAVLSDLPQLLYRYFKQHFAQVTNPPIDPIREEIVMSLVSCLGCEANLLEETPRHCRQLELPHPFLTNDELAQLKQNPVADFRAETIPLSFPVDGDPDQAMRAALKQACILAERAIAEGASVIILSDRELDERHAPIPALLGLGAVHHHLMRQGLRARAGIILETGEAREVAHMALLLGYGAGAVNPYLALSTIAELAADGTLVGVTPQDAMKRYIKALKKGVLKVMSKMGISTLASYQGAQIFEAIGVDQVVIDEYFSGTASRVRGVGLREIAEDARARHVMAFDPLGARRLMEGGHHGYRVSGERHLWSPESIAALQKATRLSDARTYEEYARLINDQRERPITLRGLWDLVPAGASVPLDEVEPARQIVKRFATGAMSFGSISSEAHETLAVAMNRIGGRSNTGEGGEDPARYHPDLGGDSRRSAIKQVASGRFGVTAHYLINADEIQIKIAQGAKPGEGGQLPGHKVDEVIARVRHSTPGVTLVSPPPHHDIYSIEDLAQLIFDLKNINPAARISVKLVAEAGVGTVAAGVAKAYADVILISGHDGGTGASPLTSIHHAGLPWELGLAEAQQVLVMNRLRGRVRLQADGQLKTGRDVVIAALLGAEEFGFATAPLVALGCVMMRKCHLNTCPVGVATQDPELRRRFTGAPEHVINYLFFVAEEARQLMASLGFRTVDEMVGRADCIAPRRDLPTPRLRSLDFSEVLYLPRETRVEPTRCVAAQEHNLRDVLDHGLIEEAAPALDQGAEVRITRRIRNRDRAFGTMLSGVVARRHGAEGLPDDTIGIAAHGSAGQSLGAFLARGISLVLDGDANDYVGKGLSGGIIAVRPPPGSTFVPEDQVIVGNTVLYGATSGSAFFNGRGGERFGVRNSGALAVVEGVGDHGCEYMTGGVVVILGTTGRNFGAGMSGGVAVVFDRDGSFPARCHPEARDAIEPLATEDTELVLGVLREHVARTGSPRAKRMLEAWDEYAPHLVKLVPREYRRALEVRRAQGTGPFGDHSLAERFARHNASEPSLVSRPTGAISSRSKGMVTAHG
ncbi:glutamate synthase large subunit [Chondromyces crocatus]|uniref:Glutamate synthase [NADPH] large chain n=1 Tax=Chondromyces crocatus TaxID=52 RepID=A0A0K1ESL5_CHOCO|nr:glutamate synthase large subunit [Chondromyces crocatus]AKT43632.1 glutamate synthase [Chondromyces crocatus]